MEYCAGDDDTYNNVWGFSLLQVFAMQLPANMEKSSSPATMSNLSQNLSNGVSISNFSEFLLTNVFPHTNRIKID